MNRAVVVLLLLIANAVVSTRTLQPPGASSASLGERPRAHSSIGRNESVAASRAPSSNNPGCRTSEDARAASWLRL